MSPPAHGCRMDRCAVTLDRVAQITRSRVVIYTISLARSGMDQWSIAAVM